MIKQIIINEIRCVTSRIFQIRFISVSRENDTFIPHGTVKGPAHCLAKAGAPPILFLFLIFLLIKKDNAKKGSFSLFQVFPLVYSC